MSKQLPDSVSKQSLIAERKAFFNEEVKAIWSRTGEESTSAIWISIRRKLQQFNLTGSYSEAHILNEAYCRGIAAIENGKMIPNPVAWMRLTSYNYICELSRSQKKTEELDEERHTSAYESSPDDDADLRAQRIRIANEALGRLKPSDQEIITLSILQDLSFREIRYILQQKTGETITEEALRKRKQRALKCLKDTYAEISQNIFNPC